MQLSNVRQHRKKQCIVESVLVVRTIPRKRFPICLAIHCLWYLLSITTGDEILGWTYFMWYSINQSDVMKGLNYMLHWNWGTPHLHIPRTRELNWTKPHFCRKHVAMKDEFRMENISLKDWAQETCCNYSWSRKENC